MFELWVHNVEGDEISMSHVFYGETEAEAEKKFEAHKAQCPALTAHFESENVIEDMVETEEPPPSPEDFPDEDDEDDEDEDEGDEDTTEEDEP